MVGLSLTDHFCAICGRPLTSPKSVELGIGPVCWGGLDKDQRLSYLIERNKTEQEIENE